MQANLLSTYVFNTKFIYHSAEYGAEASSVLEMCGGDDLDSPHRPCRQLATASLTIMDAINSAGGTKVTAITYA